MDTINMLIEDARVLAVKAGRMARCEHCPYVFAVAWDAPPSSTRHLCVRDGVKTLVSWAHI